MAIPKQMSIQVTITGREILTRTIGTDRRMEEDPLMKIVVQGVPRSPAIRRRRGTRLDWRNP